MKFLKHNESLADQYKEWAKKEKTGGVDTEKIDLIEDIKRSVLGILTINGDSSVTMEDLQADGIEYTKFQEEGQTQLIETLYQNEVEISTYNYIDEEAIDQYELDYEDLDTDMLLKIVEALKEPTDNLVL